MIEIFSCSRSRYLLGAYLLIHLVVIFIISQFYFDAEVKAALILILLLGLFALLQKELPEKYRLKFVPSTSNWYFAANNSDFVEVKQFSAIYVSQCWVLLKVEFAQNPSKSLLIGMDSLSAERFMQLRRCILAPKVLNSYLNPSLKKK